MMHQQVKRDRGQHWAILRMAGPRTLGVAEALNNAGIEAWTPSQMIEKRRPRSSVKLDIRVPIAPTFVFVRSEHLPTIRAALALPICPFPPFSIFQHAGRIPGVADDEITGLRAADAKGEAGWDQILKQRAAQKERDARDAARRTLKAGVEVKVSAPAFVGMTGVVVDSTRKIATVDLGGGFTIKIDTWLLAENDVVTRKAA